jgi:hypothetical protein
MAENIAFSDWSEKLETAGTNHWLPAYGLQQPPVAMVGNGHQQNDPTFDSGDRTDYFDDDNNGNYNQTYYTFDYSVRFVLYNTHARTYASNINQDVRNKNHTYIL